MTTSGRSISCKLMYLCCAPINTPFSYRIFIFLVFFFQAEDGIRDATVTGVQTCALPISIRECFLYIFDVPGVPLGQRSAPACAIPACRKVKKKAPHGRGGRSEEHTSELQSR